MFIHVAAKLYIIQIAYENGIQLRTSYIFIAISYTVLVSISTFFFLPRKRITEEHVAERRERRRRSTIKNINDVTKHMIDKPADKARKFYKPYLEATVYEDTE